jgi:hypothetical protein
MRELYCWGHARLVYVLGGAECRRPRGAADWTAIDRSLGEAIDQCPLKVVVAVAAEDAKSVAEGIYVLHEGGETTVDAVFAIGHVDRSTSWCVTDSLIEPNRPELDELLADTTRATRAGDLEAALMSIASGIRRLRGGAASRLRSR